MSGIARAVGTIAGAVIGGIVAGPIGAAIGSVIGSTVTSLIFPVAKPPLLGSASDITIGADQPAPYMMGDTYCGGARVHQVGYGPTIDKIPNPYLACVDVYSVGGPISGIDQYFADFEPIVFSGSGATGYFSNILFQQTFTGALLQSTALGGQWGAIPQWGADARLSGKAHVLWSARWDNKTGKYTSGLPQFGIRGRGVLTWDPRADSTFPGGSGVQRWTAPVDRAAFDAARATWTYTARPGLHALRYALGTWERDLNSSTSDYVLMFGIGMKVDQIVVEDFVALENVCDAAGWEVAGVIREPGNKWDNLKRILECGGAEPCWKGGRLGVKLTAPRVSLDTIGAGDLAEGDLRAQGAAGWRDVINAVIPKWTSPDHKWELQEGTKITVPALIVQDGEEKLREEPFELVKSPTQAAQLATYRLYDSREFGPIELPVLPRLRGYHGGDRLTLAPALVDALGLPHGEVVVISRAFDPGSMTGTLTVMGETAAKHAAALAQVGTAPPALTLPTAAQYDGAAGSITTDLVGSADLTTANSTIAALKARIDAAGIP